MPLSIHPVSRLTPTSWRVPNPPSHTPSPLTTRRSRIFSASRQPHSYHLTGHATARSTNCLGPHSPRVKSTPCPSRSARQWRSTSRRLSNKGLSALPPLRQPQACSSSWARRLEALHRLPDPQCSHSQTLLSTSSSPGHTRGTPWGSHFLEAGPEECIQPHSYPGRRRVEDGLHNHLRSLRVPGHAVCLPGVHEQGFPGVPSSHHHSLH